MKIISTFVSSVPATTHSAGNKTRSIPQTTDAAPISTGGFQGRRIANGPGLLLRPNHGRFPNCLPSVRRYSDSSTFAALPSYDALQCLRRRLREHDLIAPHYPNSPASQGGRSPMLSGLEALKRRLTILAGS